MTDKNKAKLILERWLIGIKREDRRHDKMPSLFDSLASQLFLAGIDFDVSYSCMKEASKSLYPAAETVRHVYSKSIAKKGLSINDFAKKWHESLDKASLEAFYEYYKIDGIENTKVLSKPDSSGMKTEDELNEEDFWKSTKLVSKDRPWLYEDGE